MFESQPRSRAQADPIRSSAGPTPATPSGALARRGDALNAAPRVARLAQARQTLNASVPGVVQLMPLEMRKPFVDEAVERAEKRGITGGDLARVRMSAHLLAERDKLSVDDAVLKMEIEYRRIELANEVAQAEDRNVPRSEIAEGVANRFGASVRAVIDRFVAPFVDENGRLPEGFLAEVSHWAAVGAKDVEAVVTDKVGEGLVDEMPRTGEYMDQLDRFVSANIDFGKYYGREEGGLRSIVHFVWSGRPISESARANIESWAERAKGTAWQVVLWTDAAISDWVKAKPPLQRSGVKLLDVTGVVDPRFHQAYHFARKHNLAGASDLIRLSVLKKYGGIYVDVDIGPGEIDLAKTSIPGPLERPLLAPGIRDAKGVRNLLGLDANTPVTKEHVKEAARRQRLEGQPNNNFIASAPNSIGLDPVINHIADATTSMDESAWASAGGFIAGVTGPMAIGGILDRMTDKGQLPKRDPSESVTDLPLEWLTPDSEDQAWAH